MRHSFISTASWILGLFNHGLSDSEREEILSLLDQVRAAEFFDKLAADVSCTLEERVLTYQTPFCSIKQAQALAFSFYGEPNAAAMQV